MEKDGVSKNSIPYGNTNLVGKSLASNTESNFRQKLISSLKVQTPQKPYACYIEQDFMLIKFKQEDRNNQMLIKKVVKKPKFFNNELGEVNCTNQD